MQKVTYVNLYGEKIEFAGGPPLLLRSVSGFSRPDASIVRTQGAYQAGETFSRLQLPARSVEVAFDVPPAASREALYRERMRMERVLAGGRCLRDGETGLLLYENDAGKWQTGAVPDGTITYGRRVQNALVGGKVRFLCPDAYLQDWNEQSAQMRMGHSGLVLPTTLPVSLGSRRFSASLVNGGTADAPVIVTIYGTGETPSLVNHTTGAVIAVEKPVASGERLVVDTDPRALSCVLHKADGTQEDAFGYLDASAAVSAFSLAPGVNEVEYAPGVASADSRVEISWRARYDGV